MWLFEQRLVIDTYLPISGRNRHDIFQTIFSKRILRTVHCALEGITTKRFPSSFAPAELHRVNPVPMKSAILNNEACNEKLTLQKIQLKIRVLMLQTLIVLLSLNH